jgi:MoxR-like ATPase
MGLGFVQLNLATQEVGDLVGLLLPNSKKGTVAHARPEWFPTEGKGIVFLDELNRAHPDVIQAMFSFITEKKIHTHVLPEGWHIVAAGNYSTDEFNTTDTSDAAWMSRFCHINLQPSVEEFALFAEKRGAVTVSDFISEQNDMLEASKRKIPEIHVTPDRRAWLEMLAPLENEDFEDASTRYEIYSGIVGQAASAAFIAFKKSNEKKIRLRDILRGYASVRSRVLSLTKGNETRFDALSTPLDELAVRLSEEGGTNTLDQEGVQNLKAYFLDIPLELVCQVCKKLGKLEFRGKNEILNDAEFNKRLFGIA